MLPRPCTLFRCLADDPESTPLRRGFARYKSRQRLPLARSSAGRVWRSPREWLADGRPSGARTQGASNSSAIAVSRGRSIRAASPAARRRGGFARPSYVRASSRRADAELAVDVACVGADGLDADVQLGGDLAVRAAALQQVEHGRFAPGVSSSGPLAGGVATSPAVLSQHLQAARGEMDRAQHVARLRLLRQGTRSRRTRASGCTPAGWAGWRARSGACPDASRPARGLRAACAASRS